jgi:hypothetical protein
MAHGRATVELPLVLLLCLACRSSKIWPGISVPRHRLYCRFLALPGHTLYGSVHSRGT